MLRNARKETLVALLLIAPFVAVYGLIFVYPTISMLIGSGKWVGFENYARLPKDSKFTLALWNTGYFVLLSVIPGTFIALLVALGVSRLKGWLQSAVLALFFLPYILPVAVVYFLWDWIMNYQFGLAMHVLDFFGLERVPVFKTITWFMPAAALATIWWTAGFSFLLFLAGIRAIPPEIFEAAALDNSGPWRTFRKITWPLLWPITALVLTIQLILQLKIFDQVYLFSTGGRPNDTLVMVQYIFNRAFVNQQGGRAAAIAVSLFIIVIIISVFQYQLLRLAGDRK
jgi:multiple sugar transport system permease protein